MYCVNCGEAMKEQWKHCPKCGSLKAFLVISPKHNSQDDNKCPYKNNNTTSCHFCNSPTIKQCQSHDGNREECEYGDCQYVCTVCGAVGSEIFGHGIIWRKI